MLELIVRIKALLRRNIPDNCELLAIGQYTLYVPTQRLGHSQGNSVLLTIIETKILRELVINRGGTVDASVLMQLIWQRDDPYSRNSLHGFIHKLRHDSSISILNQRGIGYRLQSQKKKELTQHKIRRKLRNFVDGFLVMPSDKPIWRNRIQDSL